MLHSSMSTRGMSEEWLALNVTKNVPVFNFKRLFCDSEKDSTKNTSMMLALRNPQEPESVSLLRKGYDVGVSLYPDMRLSSRILVDIQQLYRKANIESLSTVLTLKVRDLTSSFET